MVSNGKAGNAEPTLAG